MFVWCLCFVYYDDYDVVVCWLLILAGAWVCGVVGDLLFRG